MIDQNIEGILGCESEKDASALAELACCLSLTVRREVIHETGIQPKATISVVLADNVFCPPPTILL